MELQEGSIIEFKEKNQHQIAIVLREDRKKRIHVLTSTGREVSLTSKQVTCAPGSRISGQKSTSEMRTFLQSLVEAATQSTSDEDFELLWEIALEENPAGTLFSVAELATLLFDSNDANSKLTCLLMLRKTNPYFKDRGNKGFEVRSEDQVATVRRAEEIQNEKEQLRQRFLDTTVSIAVLSSREEKQTALAKALEDLQYRKFFDIIHAYALGGDEASAQSKANPLLDSIHDAGLPLDEYHSLRAFDLLVKIGHWDLHENLTMRRLELTAEFDEDAIAQAAALTEAAKTQDGPPIGSGITSPDQREVIKGLIFSIDDEETKDIDDALSVEALPDGGWRVGIHIAAPTYHIPMESPLELAARGRGATIYVPTGRIPMFPFSLSEGLFSLIAGEERAALSFLVDFDESFEQQSYRIVPSLITVTERLTYDSAEMELMHGHGPISEALQQLYTISDMLMPARLDAGAVVIDLPEVKPMVLDEAGEEIQLIRTQSNSIAHELVAEMMVLANTLAADFCSKNNLPVAYRTQEAPEEDLQSAELLAYPEGPARAIATIRRMRPAQSSMEPAPHAGLGVQAYIQASSPIRRYGDFLTHLQIHSFIQNGEPALSYDELSHAITPAESSTKGAKLIGREAQEYWMMRYLERQGHAVLSATVVDHLERKILILLDETLLRASVIARKPPPLGSKVQVRVVRCHPRAGQLQVQMIESSE